jgi:sigma-B regulation protein RsbU (phosphoserine phosphatase)
LAAVHAAVIQNILTHSFFKLLPNIITILIELLLLSTLFILSIRFTSLSLSIGAFLVAGIYVFLGGFFFVTNNLIFTFTRTLFLFSCTLILLLIGLGIEKALLFAETERARRLAERELEIGREIQSGFFPTTLPEAPGWDLKIHFQAARHVAGDFYDVFTIGPERKMCIIVADVCDKGVGAALFMALFRSFIRVLSGQAESENHINGNMDPKEILKKTIGAINNYISITHETAGMFATIFYCIIDPKTGECYYINGGHEPPVIIGEGKIKARLYPTGPAVGAYPNIDYKVASATLETEGTLLVFTDGVTDALDKAGQSFTKARLEDMLRHPFTSANDLIGSIKSHINDHITGADQFDDITIAALMRKT